MSFNGIFMAVPGYHHILQGYYEGNFICFTWKSFGDILKKCIKQQFKRAKIFGSIFLDFSPAWEKSVLGGRCRRERKELAITLFPSPSAPFPNSLWHSKWTWGWRGRMLLLKSSLPDFSVEGSDSHEHEQETSPWSRFQAWIINGCISSPLIASPSGDVFFGLTSVNTCWIYIKSWKCTIKAHRPSNCCLYLKI